MHLHLIAYPEKSPCAVRNTPDDRNPVRTMKRAIRGVSVILTGLLPVLSCVKDHTGSCLQAGERIPPFHVITIEGRDVTATDLVGRPSVIVFFDTRCPDCHRQLPEIEAIRAAAGEEIAILAVARDEDTETVSRYWKAARYTMPVSAPGKRDVFNLFDRESGTGVPQVYVCDPAGVVILVGTDKRFLYKNDILSACSTGGKPTN